jgi:hypothetical protein
MFGASFFWRDNSCNRSTTGCRLMEGNRTRSMDNIWKVPPGLLRKAASTDSTHTADPKVGQLRERVGLHFNMDAVALICGGAILEIIECQAFSSSWRNRQLGNAAWLNPSLLASPKRLYQRQNVPVNREPSCIPGRNPCSAVTFLRYRSSGF